MKIKQTVTTVVMAISLFGGVFLAAQPANATTCDTVPTAIIECNDAKGDYKNVKDNGVWELLKLTLNILTAVIGVAAVGGIAYGAALYAGAADSPDRAKKGMEFIKNVVIGVIAYGLMYVMLNFLIPGGVIG